MFSPICPYCDSIAAHPVESRDGEAFAGLIYTGNGTEIKMYCRACTAIWADRYKVDSRVLLKRGLDIEPKHDPQTSLFTKG